MRYVLIILFLIGFSLGAWAFVIEPSRVVFREENIYIKNWPAELAGLKIAFLSDIHAGAPFVSLGNLKKIIAKTNALKPDLILLGGDYVIEGVIGGTPTAPKDIFKAFNAFRAPMGVYAVMGNHEWWYGDKKLSKLQRYKKIVEAFYANAPGLHLLEDKAIRLKRGRTEFFLLGISDFNEGPHSYQSHIDDVMAPIIALTHSPDIFPNLPEKVNLTFAGHTHGGQVYLPGIGRLIVPSRYKEVYALGLVEEGNKTLFVSAGVGTSMLCVRFLTPPEVNIVTIYPKSEGEVLRP